MIPQKSVHEAIRSPRNSSCQEFQHKPGGKLIAVMNTKKTLVTQFDALSMANQRRPHEDVCKMKNSQSKAFQQKSECKSIPTIGNVTSKASQIAQDSKSDHLFLCSLAPRKS
jgi:hypothetical protein